MKQTITTGNAPKALGPYSQAVVYGGLAYLSGQIPIDPGNNKLIEGEMCIRDRPATARQTGCWLDALPAAAKMILLINRIARSRKCWRCLCIAVSASCCHLNLGGWEESSGRAHTPLRCQVPKTSG